MTKIRKLKLSTNVTSCTGKHIAVLTEKVQNLAALTYFYLMHDVGFVDEIESLRKALQKLGLKACLDEDTVTEYKK